VITAIIPDGGTLTKTLTTADAVAAFVDKHDGQRNLYFHPNVVKADVKKKASKEDIAAVEFIHADLDPRPDEMPEAAKKRYLESVAKLGWEVSAVIDTGNGLQVLCRYERAIILGDDAAVREAEDRNLALVRKLGGPAGTQDVSRLLRLPGTTNLPTKKKRAEGRVACQAKIVRLSNATYPQDDPLPVTKRAKPAGEIDPDDVEDIEPDDPRLEKLGAKWKKIGHDDDPPEKGKRSEPLFAFVCECIRAGVTDDVIASCVMYWKIGQHVRDEPDVKRALNRTIRRAHACVEDSTLFKMNEKHCVLPIGGKTRVATWGNDPDFPGRTTITMFSSLTDFKALHDKYRHTYEAKDKKGNAVTVTVGLGTWWVDQPGRRQYDGGIRFMPTRDEDVVGNTLNLWQGFAVPARRPEGKSGADGCKLFLDHGLKVICSGNEAHFEYLIKREAWIAQMRRRSEVAVSLRTEVEGTGKGVWARSIGHIYGRHSMQLLRPEHVVGKFNPHLELLLVVIADEAVFAGDPRHRNVLHGLTTEPVIPIERKFVDVYNAENHLNLYILSNARHIVDPGVKGGRRYFIPTVSSDKASDHEYFRKIIVQLVDEGGYEALLFHLLHEVDVRDFNVRAVPKTAGLAEQAAYSRRGIDLLVEQACSEGVVPCQYHWANFSLATGYEDRAGFDYFIDHHPDRELSRMGALTVKRRLTKEWGCLTGKDARQWVEGNFRYGVVWPPLEQLRAKFEEKHGEQEWLSPETTEWQARSNDEQKSFPT
jgi:hypothetical protein